MNIRLPFNYEPRAYQLPLLQAMDSGFRRAVWVAHRRSGKDKTCVNIIAKKMMERVGVYYYVFPTYNQGRKILWDGIDRDGKKFLDHFPAELLDGKPNDTEMKLRFKNGSLFQIVGSDHIDSIVGTNPVGVVFSEYSLQDPIAWGYLRPILAENDGWAIFVYTPRGENHGYEIYELAKSDPAHWFSQLLTVDDTGVIPSEVLEQERKEIIRLYGDDSLFLQEYYCNFTVPIRGSYYAEHVARAYRDGRVGVVPHEPTVKVETAWDLGMDDRMCIWFFQCVGSEVRVIDYMEGSGKGIPDYISEIKQTRPHYIFGMHIGPHDIEVRDLSVSGGKTRRDVARALGFDFRVAPKLPIMDGIDAVRNLFSRCWFDRERCREGLNALKSYRKQYDEKRKTYLNTPYHDWSSNGSDAFRMLAVTLDPRYKGQTAVEGDKYSRASHRRPESVPMAVLG